MTQELLSCPFCGWAEPDMQSLEGMYNVDCPDCCGAGPIADTPNEARTSWNTRTQVKAGASYLKAHLEAKRLQMSHDSDVRAAGYLLGGYIDALATIPDPQAFMEAARGMREALQECGVEVGMLSDWVSSPALVDELSAKHRRAQAAIATFDATLGEQ